MGNVPDGRICVEEEVKVYEIYVSFFLFFIFFFFFGKDADRRKRYPVSEGISLLLNLCSGSLCTKMFLLFERS